MSTAPTHLASRVHTRPRRASGTLGSALQAANRSVSRPVAFGARLVVQWRALLVAVLGLTLGAALLQGVAGERSSAGSAVRADGFSNGGLLSLPLAAHGPVSAAIGADQRSYRVSTGGGLLHAANPAQHMRAQFGRGGMSVSSGATLVRLSLRAAGYGTSLTALGEVTPSGNANRVTYAHPGVEEWYANGPLGLEQGFTIPKAPSAHSSQPLTLSMALSGNARPARASGGQTIILRRSGGPSLRYSGLSVTDARGRALRGWFQLARGRLLLRVDARGARYPLQIDPFIEQEKLIGSGQIGKAQFGEAVAVSADGNTALVAGPADNTVGAVWVFTRAGLQWTQQAKLTENAPGTGGFGASVALSADGTTALIGGHDETADVAWAFARSGTTWTQQGKLVGSGAANSVHYWCSVALSADGNTALLGSFDDNEQVGAAWVFVRSGSSWEQQGEKLTGSGEIGKGVFGLAVALSGDGNTALIGGEWDNGEVGAAWTFTRSGSSWQQQGEKLTGAGVSGEAWFGRSVALSGDGSTALIGGPMANHATGATWAYSRSGSSWEQQGPILTPSDEIEQGEVGNAVALSADGSVALIGGYDDHNLRGAAWIFRRSGSTWSQQGVKLTAAGEQVTSQFGYTAALTADGNTALIGGGGNENGAWVFIDTHSAPYVASVAPAGGPASGGTAVTITGSNLATATAVAFGATPATSFTVNANTTVTAVSPAGAGTVDVTVTTPDGTSATGAKDRFSYEPSVTSVTPASGSREGGTVVKVGGTNLLGATAVRFGAAAAVSYTVNSNSSITAVSPAGTGTVDVTVTTPGGTSATSVLDQFRYQDAPEYGRCIKLAKGVKGLFATANCTVPATAGKYAYEWAPGAGPNATFTTKLKPLTVATLETVTKKTVVCSGESGTGQYTGRKTVGDVTVTLTGCQLNGAKCSSQGAQEGEVTSTVLDGALGIVKASAEGPLKDTIGMDLFPSAETDFVLKFSCGAIPIAVRGSVIVPVPRNGMKLTANLPYAQGRGKQKPESFEGEAKDILEASINEGPFEQTGLKLTLIETNEEKIEVNSVV
jgi:hypothetical protein